MEESRAVSSIDECNIGTSVEEEESSTDVVTVAAATVPDSSSGNRNLLVGASALEEEEEEEDCGRIGDADEVTAIVVEEEGSVDVDVEADEGKGREKLMGGTS